MSTETEQADDPAASPKGLVGGRLVAKRLKAHGVTKLFTLSGGHLFSIYDGCREEGIDLVDVRHESAAAFAAEGWAKVTRQPGVAALTAGPGVTNGMSALASAQQNSSPMLVLGGRAPAMRWGQGSLQEIDHVPFVRPLTKFAATPETTAEIPALVDEALTRRSRRTPARVRRLPAGRRLHGGARSPTRRPLAGWVGAVSAAGPVPDVARAAALLRDAERPVIMAGTNLYWGHGEEALLALAQELGIPVFLNGLARGCVPADHELFFSRARSNGLKGADVALVIGVPMDFRLGFGAVLRRGDRARGHRPRRAAARAPARRGRRALRVDPRDPRRAALGGRVRSGHGRVGPHAAGRRGREARGRARRARRRPRPLHPMRLYRDLGEVLDRDAIVIGDGGDFVSYAGRVVDTYQPGCWLDPGPFGCLGSGPGYALAAKVAHPDRQVVLLLGDGAFGFSGMEFDTFARLGINVVAVMGNNGIWALEKHPMEFLYGYSVAAELRPGTRYDQVVEALGCHGELVERPADLKPALERAFSANAPALVNVLTDPDVVYPRRSNLA